MPLLNVKLIEGVFTSKQKQEMIRKLTDTMVSIEGENMRQATVVIIEEVKSGDWGFGGTPYSTADVKKMAAGKSKGGDSTKASRQPARGKTARRGALVAALALRRGRRLRGSR
jgi:4-oxalocrotonate tautomerase